MQRRLILKAALKAGLAGVEVSGGCVVSFSSTWMPFISAYPRYLCCDLFIGRMVEQLTLAHRVQVYQIETCFDFDLAWVAGWLVSKSHWKRRSH